MSLLEVHDLSVEVTGLAILEGLTFGLRAGDKVGVVGRNGAGKTSLLKVIAGEQPPATGSVRVRGTLGYLRQDPRQHRGGAVPGGRRLLGRGGGSTDRLRPGFGAGPTRSAGSCAVRG
jgi:ATPase subunit of ABC transporter with duplicated ATPase domains